MRTNKETAAKIISRGPMTKGITVRPAIKMEIEKMLGAARLMWRRSTIDVAPGEDAQD